MRRDAAVACGARDQGLASGSATGLQLSYSVRFTPLGVTVLRDVERAAFRIGVTCVQSPRTHKITYLYTVSIQTQTRTSAEGKTQGQAYSDAHGREYGSGAHIHVPAPCLCGPLSGASARRPQLPWATKVKTQLVAKVHYVLIIVLEQMTQQCSKTGRHH